MYSGFIEISDGDQSFHVTYLGLVGSLIDKQVIDDTDFFFGIPLPFIFNSTGAVQEGPVNYTFAGDDFPIFVWR